MFEAEPYVKMEANSKFSCEKRGVRQKTRHTRILPNRTHKQMSETQSPEVALVSGGTDSISAVLDTGSDFCQSHLYCNYDMIIMYFIIYVGQIQSWWLLAENING